MATTISSVAELKQAYLDYQAAHPYRKEPIGLYEPVDYILQLGGKRVRPILSLLGAQLFSDNWQQALPIAQAVEVFHNFTLLHDDIMDDSPLRRGQATVHEKWDVNTGILSGDLMLIKAYESLLQTPHKDRIPELLRVFNRVAVGVCEGQQYDVDFEQRDDVTIDEYLKMIELKTAVLLGGALEMGAIAADADAKAAAHLYEFGRFTGIAFQLQDDLLDTFGTTEQIGKSVGNDIVRNKKTFLYLKSLEVGSLEVRTELIDFFSAIPADSSAKVVRVTQIMEALNIPEMVAQMRDEYQEQAYHHLEASGAPEERQRPIRELTEALLHRNS